MAVPAQDVRVGMAVFDRESERVGTISRVWPEERYFESQQGGVLGEGGQRMYIPFDAIADLAAEQHLILTCSLDTCLSDYSHPPTFLQL